MKKAVYLWINAVIVIAAVAILSLVTLNQFYAVQRYSETDRLARQAKLMLDHGQSVSSLLPQVTVEEDDAPFIMVYNSDNTPAYTNAVYHGEQLLLPLQVALSESEEIEHRTWRPAADESYVVSTAALKDGRTLAIGAPDTYYERALNKASDQVIYAAAALALLCFPCMAGLAGLFKIR